MLDIVQLQCTGETMKITCDNNLENSKMNFLPRGTKVPDILLRFQKVTWKIKLEIN